MEEPAKPLMRRPQATGPSIKPHEYYNRLVTEGRPTRTAEWPYTPVGGERGTGNVAMVVPVLALAIPPRGSFNKKSKNAAVLDWCRANGIKTVKLKWPGYDPPYNLYTTPEGRTRRDGAWSGLMILQFENEADMAKCKSQFPTVIY